MKSVLKAHQILLKKLNNACLYTTQKTGVVTWCWVLFQDEGKWIFNLKFKVDMRHDRRGRDIVLHFGRLHKTQPKPQKM